MQGENINLQGDHGQGRRETVKDTTLLLPSAISLFRLDIRRDRVEPNRWLSEAVEEQGSKLLILHNFDELDEQKSSNRRFVERLSTISDCKNTALLMVTVELPEQWLLNIETVRLPALPGK